MHQNLFSLHTEKILNGLSSNLKTFSSNIWVFSFKKKFRSHARSFELGHIPFKNLFPHLHLWQNMKLRFIFQQLYNLENSHYLILSKQVFWLCSRVLKYIHCFNPPPQWKKSSSKSGKIQSNPRFPQVLLCWYLFKIVTEFTLKYKKIFTVHSNPCHSRLKSEKSTIREFFMSASKFDIQNHVTTLIQTIFIALISNL